MRPIVTFTCIIFSILAILFFLPTQKNLFDVMILLVRLTPALLIYSLDVSLDRDGIRGRDDYILAITSAALPAWAFALVALSYGSPVQENSTYEFLMFYAFLFIPNVIGFFTGLLSYTETYNQTKPTLSEKKANNLFGFLLAGLICVNVFFLYLVI